MKKTENKKKKLITASVLMITVCLICTLSSIPAHQINPFIATLDETYEPITTNYIEEIGTYIIWENKYPDGQQYIRCQRAGEVEYCDVADDFHTEKIWTITGAQWDTADNFQYNWDGACDFLIYDFTMEGPGDPIVELWDVTGTRELIYEFPDENWYRYTIDLVDQEMEFDLPAGDYYILLRPVTGGSTGRSNWLTSSGHPESQSELYLRCEPFGYPNWTAGHEVLPGQYLDVSFRVFGTGENIPELELGEITGGFGAKTSIKNIGDGDATNVYWTMSFDGGLVLFPPDGIKTGVFPALTPSQEESMNTMVFRSS